MILPGETVAFVNVQGAHDVDGITNTRLSPVVHLRYGFQKR